MRDDTKLLLAACTAIAPPMLQENIIQYNLAHHLECQECAVLYRQINIFISAGEQKVHELDLLTCVPLKL